MCPSPICKVGQNLTKSLFLVFHIFEKLFLKLSQSFKNLILKMVDYDFSIQDFVHGCPLQSQLFGVWRALGNEPQIH